MRKSLRKTALVLLSVFFGFLATEITMRYLLKNKLALPSDEKSLAYRHDSKLGWFPHENSRKTHTASRTITIEHNSRGFRDDEHLISDKPRMVVLGDSFVWGFDVEKHERFVEKLRLKMPEWAIYNLGVSGYGTDQELLLLKDNYDYYQPDIIFLLFCAENDEYDNTRNKVYAGYYKPYFNANQDYLKLRGVPVPKSENSYLHPHNIFTKIYWFRLALKAYFRIFSPELIEVENPTPTIIHEMNNIAKSRGARLIVGSTKTHQDLAEFLSDMNIDFIDLSNSHRNPRDGYHWTPAGHALVCDKIFDFLQLRGYLPPPIKPSFPIPG